MRRSPRRTLRQAGADPVDRRAAGIGRAGHSDHAEALSRELRDAGWFDPVSSRNCRSCPVRQPLPPAAPLWPTFARRPAIGVHRSNCCWSMCWCRPRCSRAHRPDTLAGRAAAAAGGSTPFYARGGGSPGPLGVQRAGGGRRSSVRAPVAAAIMPTCHRRTDGGPGARRRRPSSPAPDAVVGASSAGAFAPTRTAATSVRTGAVADGYAGRAAAFVRLLVSAGSSL